jgi:WD40 repeat protein
MVDHPDRWRRLEAVVQGALARPAGDRAAFLAEACGGDEDLRREAASRIAGVGARGRVLRRAVVTAIVVLLAVVGAASIWWWRSAVGAGAVEVQQRQVTFSGDVEMSALSPDGRTVAYVPRGFGQVLVREPGGGQPSPIWTGKNVMALSWLPDGSHLVVTEGSRSVWMVPRLGGAPRRVAASGRMAAPSSDGAALALTADGLAGFSTLSLASGETRVVTLAGFSRVLAIDWHARTNRVVLSTPGDDEQVWNVWSVTPDGRDQSRLLTGSEYIRAICSSPVSDVVYVMREQRGSMDLLRVPVYPDPGAVRVLVTGLPVTAMGYRCTVSADGRQLLYGRNASVVSLWTLDVASPAAHATRLRHGTLPFLHPAVSPDGLWIAGTAAPDVAAQVVRIPIGGGEPVRLGDGERPAWSPDGRHLAFVSRRSGSPRVWISGADGQGPEEVTDSAVGGQPPVWLPDGRLAWQTPDRQNYRIRDLVTGRDQYLFHDASLSRWVAPKFSPRGDRLVLANGSGGPRAGLLLLSWPGREPRVLTRPVQPIGWSADGEWIYAIQPDGRALVRVSLRTEDTETLGQVPAGLDVLSCDLTAGRDAVVCSLIERRADAWVLAGFDPDIR